VSYAVLLSTPEVLSATHLPKHHQQQSVDDLTASLRRSRDQDGGCAVKRASNTTPLSLRLSTSMTSTQLLMTSRTWCHQYFSYGVDTTSDDVTSRLDDVITTVEARLIECRCNFLILMASTQILMMSRQGLMTSSLESTLLRLSTIAPLSGLDAHRRRRTAFTSDQLLELEKEMTSQQFMMTTALRWN